MLRIISKSSDYYIFTGGLTPCASDMIVIAVAYGSGSLDDAESVLNKYDQYLTECGKHEN